jgi:hypothetical protein
VQTGPGRVVFEGWFSVLWAPTDGA